jgi:hypothetical protein
MSGAVQVAGPRDVTPEEIAHYRENGWVKLDALVDETTVGELFTRITKLMGVDADVTRHPGENRSGGHEQMWNTFVQPSAEDEFFHDFVFSGQMAKLGWQLAGRPVRYWVDQTLVKLPAGSGGGDEKTFWHLDLPAQPQDRPGQMQLWIALRDVPPERGSLRFLNGSHKHAIPENPDAARPLLEQLDAASGEEARRLNGLGLEASYEELDAKGVLSPPLDMKAGDVTIHHSNTLHSAPANSTSEARWAYVVSLVPADTCYTGHKSWVADGVEGLEVGKPMNVPRFPVLAPPADWFDF